MWTCRIAVLLMIFWITSASPVVKTTHGPIEGTTLTLFNGKEVDAFLGVPYAAPPTGQNRFAPPQPMAPWNETLKVKDFPNTCPQTVTKEMKENDWWVSNFTEDEDCLGLNVWLPTERKEKMAIIFFIPGGGFVGGSSQMPIYNPSILASETGLMVVTMNYRLGMFGFLCLNNSDVPGNAGLQDQIQAVRWIKENAEAFGGDPDRITLLGQSASSMAVETHLTNRHFSTSFRSAILHSGSIGSPADSLTMPQCVERSKELSEKVGCPSENSGDMLACLRDTSVEKLQNTYDRLFTNNQLTYAPVRNGIEVPLDIFNHAQNFPASERKNIMSGEVPLEAGFVAHTFIPGKYVYNNFMVTPQDMSDMVKNVFQLRDDRLQSAFIHEYKKFDGTADPNNMRIEALEALSDFAFLCPQIRFAKQWVTENTNAFFYYFTRRPSQPLKYALPDWLGTLHGDDVPFITGAVLDPERGYSDEDKDMSRMLMKIWSTFAKTGNPNSASTGVNWPTLKPGGNFTYMEINEGFKIKYFLEERQCDFLYNVYPNLVSIQQEI